MRRLSRILSLLLLALWLPATQHCALEAAGIVRSGCEDDGCTSDPTCSLDTCATFEAAFYQSTARATVVVAPLARPCPGLICLLLAPHLVEKPAGLRSDRSVRPRDWVPQWHFVRRAAPPSRAPTALIA